MNIPTDFISAEGRLFTLQSCFETFLERMTRDLLRVNRLAVSVLVVYGSLEANPSSDAIQEGVYNQLGCPSWRLCV